nr:glycosyltransferase [Fretibacterium sp.]
IGGVIGRLTAWRHGGIKTIYTAHGFHFYNGAPLGNWLAFYPVEKTMARITDVLITINTEDYERARRSFCAREVYYVPGIGIDLQKFCVGQIDVKAKRAELGVREDEILILSVGELIPRKDHETVIRALARTGRQGFQYLICGTGPLHEMLSALVHQEGLDGRVKLLGFRTDIAELCQAADLFVFPSRQEGLSVAMMEAIACETPVVCSAIRGNTDLVQNKECLFRSGSVQELAAMLRELIIDGRDALRQAMRCSVVKNHEQLRKFDLKAVEVQMRKIYSELLE